MRLRTVQAPEGCREELNHGWINGHCGRYSSWASPTGQKMLCPGKGAEVYSNLFHGVAVCPRASAPPSLGLSALSQETSETILTPYYFRGWPEG